MFYFTCDRSFAGAEVDSADALSFETLIPKNIVERYVALLVEHRRLILCGPTGTGKTYLASRLAQHLVRRSVMDWFDLTA